MTDPLDLPSEWSPVVLHRVWDLIAGRLERSGAEASGRLVIPGLDLAERQCVGELLGRAIMADRVSVDLEVVDRLLLERDGIGLVAAVEQVRGEPLVARPRRRSSGTTRREAPFEAAADWFAAYPEVDWPWVESWFAGLRREGTLLRDADPAALLRTAIEVLADRRDALATAPGGRLPLIRGGSAGPVALTRLAERTTTDRHALDSDRLLSVVVLRALAARTGGGTPGGPGERRALWETAGVVTDRVSATCLTWGLIGRGLPGAPHDGCRPVHLTWWDLEAGARVEAPHDILVCEDPAVLEEVARAEIEIGVICTGSRPDLLVSEVITRARAGGARLRHHGNLDWPGVALANDVLAHYGAVPWSMGVEDYLAAAGSLPLAGSPVEPAWDHDLGAAMRRRGVVGHHEVAIERLLDTLQ